MTIRVKDGLVACRHMAAQPGWQRDISLAPALTTQMSRTRYLQNDLEPVVLDESNLRQARRRLRRAILDGVALIESSTGRGLVPNQSIYVGNAGPCNHIRRVAGLINMSIRRNQCHVPASPKPSSSPQFRARSHPSPLATSRQTARVA